MIDKQDKQTIDAFPAKKRGRPSTSSPEKRKADTAARVAKHRAAEKRKSVVMAQIIDKLSAPISATERGSWLELMAFVNGKGEDLDCRMDYLTPSGRDGSKSATLSVACDLIEKGYTLTKLV
jgi:hypothetical protein